MAREIGQFINDNKAYFDTFNKIVIYYDNGQETLATVLDTLFAINPKVERRQIVKVLIATKNQRKIEGSKKALLNYFDNIEIIGILVESNFWKLWNKSVFPDRLTNDIIDTDLSQVMNKVFTKDDERHNKGGGI